jgi:hypothetical protein
VSKGYSTIFPSMPAILPNTMSFMASVLCEAICSVLGDAMAACTRGESANEGEVFESMVEVVL